MKKREESEEKGEVKRKKEKEKRGKRREGHPRPDGGQVTRRPEKSPSGFLVPVPKRLILS